MEEAQKKAKRAGLPITDNWISAFATSYLLITNEFPNDRPEWDGNPKADQTCKARKEKFNPLHKNLECVTNLARGEDSFGAAAATQLIHGIDPTTVPPPFNRETHLLPEGANIAKDLDVHFDHLATAATHSNEIVQGNLIQLTKSVTNQNNDIKKLLSELKSALPSTEGRSNNINGDSGGRNNLSSSQKETHDRRITQLQPAIKRKWVQGRFCSTQGHGVGYKHNSASCINKTTGHVDTATRENPAVPGEKKNKGWDNWFFS